MRVFIPATHSMLADFARDQVLPIRSGAVFGLTQAVRDFYTSGDDEELEYTAFLDAARASLRLLATEDASGAEEAFPNRRVVLAADIPDANLTADPTGGDSVLRVDPAQLELTQLRAIHTDDEDAEAATKRAKECIDDADLGDEDAELALGDCEDNLMSWYDSKELGMLVDLM
ncbi:hypothetical protein [Corynebacterium sp. HMSC27B11]|uniref:DUF6912 family protein n=1 Tax=Corynebacterium sp. HMSC27B11 TaxID=1581065 RepID=UPI0008A14534|nr:hypothetical protein [Corynebacterium sp. HMSC27B11]OFS17323.1 hypothetical protein HMPREF3097_05430 [Corynebacterium sp. HMSC27B11]